MIANIVIREDDWRLRISTNVTFHENVQAGKSNVGHGSWPCMYSLAYHDRFMKNDEGIGKNTDHFVRGIGT